VARSWSVRVDYRGEFAESELATLAHDLADELDVRVTARDGLISITFRVDDRSITEALDPTRRRRIAKCLERSVPEGNWRLVGLEIIDRDEEERRGLASVSVPSVLPEWYLNDDEPPAVWSIRALVETNDSEVVGAMSDAIGEVLCPSANLADAQHRCDPPWFVVVSELSTKKAQRWRTVLNR
jgi:hypothetical protein